MIPRLLILILGVIALLLLATLLEKYRERSLRRWAGRRPGANLHWGFVPEEHPGLPAGELTQLIIGQPPLGYASALQLAGPAGDLWFVEYRTTPPGRKSDRWFTLLALQCADETSAQDCLTHLQTSRSAQIPRLVGNWVCLRLEGLMSVRLLESNLGI